jgi:hypothetical protein
MISRTGLFAVGSGKMKIMMVNSIPNKPSAPNTRFSTPKTVTEVGRCMIAFQMVALPFADNRKICQPPNFVESFLYLPGDFLPRFQPFESADTSGSSNQFRLKNFFRRRR